MLWCGWAGRRVGEARLPRRLAPEESLGDAGSPKSPLGAQPSATMGAGRGAGHQVGPVGAEGAGPLQDLPARAAARQNHAAPPCPAVFGAPRPRPRRPKQRAAARRPPGDQKGLPRHPGSTPAAPRRPRPAGRGRRWAQRRRRGASGGGTARAPWARAPPQARPRPPGPSCGTRC